MKTLRRHSWLAPLLWFAFQAALFFCAVCARADEFSNENLRLTVVHMQSLAKQLNETLAAKEEQLEKARADYAEATKSNASSIEALRYAQDGLVKVRAENSQLIMDRVQALHRADESDKKLSALKISTDTRIHRMKLWLCSEAALAALLLALWLRVPSLATPYGLLFTFAAPAAAYAALWMIL